MPKETPREAPNGHRLEKNGVSAHPLQAAAPKAAAVTQEKSRRGSVSRSALPSATLQIDLVEARNITVNSEKKHKGAVFYRSMFLCCTSIVEVIQ